MDTNENLIMPERIKVERSARANEQMQKVADLISGLGLGSKKREEITYEFSKLLLLTEMDSVMAGYTMGLDALPIKGMEPKKGKWVY